jgi:hypothetical protein
MKFVFGGIQLTDWENFPAMNVLVNGLVATEVVDIVRAISARFFERGTLTNTVQFSVRREFATLHECQVYLLTHYSLLPKKALLQVTCGGNGEDTQDCFMADAVLANPQGSFNGVEAIVQYSIQGGAITTDVPPDFLLGGDEMILRGKEAITTNADTVDVLFSSAFPAGHAPIVNATYAKGGAGGANIIASVRDDTVTVNGFTAELSGPSPAGAFLNWTAFGT